MAGDGMTILTQFSIVLRESNSRISWVPPPISTAKISIREPQKKYIVTSE
jgi:hypothetical protein